MSWSTEIHPRRKSISSGHATFRPCRRLVVLMNDPASSKRVVRAGVEPRVAAAKDLHSKPPLVKVEAVQICDLQLAACGWTKPPSLLDHGQVVQAKPRRA